LHEDLETVTLGVSTMDELKLPAQLRTQVGSGAARRARQQGRLPAVLYGHGIDPVHLTVDLGAFEEVLAGGARVVDLVIDGSEARALIKDLQYDALGSDLLHADFQRLVSGEKVEVAIPVELLGEPVGVRRDGGVLDHLRKEITVSCLPGQIPGTIRVDVRELGIRDDITIGDIEWPEGVEPVAAADATVVAVLPPEEVPEEPELEEAKEPEVVGRGPEEPEEEGEGEAEPGGPEE
ncbi:MAG: 50S ribosomal protein L25, partial [Planctomycetes bacterium]|nr:50S ribosomal protein L25 [Planctomycetota bacterium]